MTVAELIEELKKLDGNLLVARADSECGGFLAKEVHIVSSLELSKDAYYNPDGSKIVHPDYALAWIE